MKRAPADWENRCHFGDCHEVMKASPAGVADACIGGPSIQPAIGGRLKIYVAGPMTGIPEFNFPLFNAETARLRALGYEVVNPAEVNPDTTMCWAECMKRDIPALLTCDGVALLPGWHSSRGALLERHIADALGLTVMAASDIVEQVAA
jgi:hypothetical protein